MTIIWDKGEAFVNDILAVMPEPKPAYNTVSTIVRILVTKGFLSYKSYGRSHKYYPLVQKEEYLNGYMDNVKKNFFDGSLSSMLSFFAKKEKLSSKEIEQIEALLEKNK